MTNYDTNSSSPLVLPVLQRFRLQSFDFAMVNVIFEACRSAVCAVLVHLYMCVCVTVGGGEEAD